jgi:hypothetical protein
MTPFELFFGLTSVILALALTHLANSFQLLLRAGSRVRWAVEPLLQVALIVMIIVFVWGDQWHDREQVRFTVLQSILQVLKLLAVYIAAAAILPEPREKATVDLHDHYMRSRRVVYGALLAGLLLFTAYRYLFYPAGHVPINNTLIPAIALPIIYISLMFVRWRPLHIVGLLLVCVIYAVQIAPASIG